MRGKTGTIVRDWGVFAFPDTNAHHSGTKPQHCYSVSFAARELWGNDSKDEARDQVAIDLWQDYLEPAPVMRARKSAQRRSRPTSRRKT